MNQSRPRMLNPGPEELERVAQDDGEFEILLLDRKLKPNRQLREYPLWSAS
jgi:hypothetical protein